jgi:hypothetical protein
MDAGVEPDTIVTLVHGTFAPKATWCRPNSPFRTALEAEFGSDSTSVFEWSGSNSHSARLAAATRLQDHLRDSLAQHPQANHFIVAHSHGGNVSAYALRDEKLQKKIRGLVCIATPFIRCTDRDLNLVLGHSYIFTLFPASVIAAIVLSPLLAFTYWALSVLYGSWDQVPEMAMDGVMILFCLMAIAFLIFGAGIIADKWFEPRVTQPLHKKQQSIVNRLDPPFLGITPVLNVTAAMDEAGAWLWTLRQLSAIPYYLWRPIMVVAFSAFVILEVGLGLSVFLIVLPTILPELPTLVIPGLGLTYVAGQFAGYVLSTTIASLFFLIITAAWSFLMFVTPKIIRSSSLGFGGEKFIDNLLVNIRTHNEPFAASVENLRQKVARFRAVEGRPQSLPFRLRHSALYSDERGIERMVAWLKKRKADAAEVVPIRRARTEATPLGLV